jgi:hypothetical protein
MGHLVRSASRWIPLLAVMACGGRVGLVGGGDGGDPDLEASTKDGGAGEASAEDGRGGDEGDVEPPDASACPAPSSVALGLPCRVASQVRCPSAISVSFCDGELLVPGSCACVDGEWQSCGVLVVPTCTDASPPPPPPPPTECPPPATVEQGVACSIPSQQQCAGNPQECDQAIFYDAFECDGGTWNDVAVTECAVDGGSGGFDAAGVIDAKGL